MSWNIQTLLFGVSALLCGFFPLRRRPSFPQSESGRECGARSLFRAAPAKPEVYAANPYERSSGDHKVIDGAGNLLADLDFPMDRARSKPSHRNLSRDLPRKTWIWMAIWTLRGTRSSAQSGA